MDTTSGVTLSGSPEAGVHYRDGEFGFSPKDLDSNGYHFMKDILCYFTKDNVCFCLAKDKYVNGCTGCNN